jgi:hypothetical protein
MHLLEGRGGWLGWENNNGTYFFKAIPFSFEPRVSIESAKIETQSWYGVLYSNKCKENAGNSTKSSKIRKVAIIFHSYAHQLLAELLKF